VLPHVTAPVYKNSGSREKNQGPLGIRGRAGDSHAQAGPPAIAGHAPGDPDGRALHHVTLAPPLRGYVGERFSLHAPAGSTSISGGPGAPGPGGEGPAGTGWPGLGLVGSPASDRERSTRGRDEGLHEPDRAQRLQAAPSVAHGHYHATPLQDGDWWITPCSEDHRRKNDGRSIEACGTGAWSKAVFPAISKPMRLSNIEGLIGQFFCKSWRCDNCRPYVFRRDFARVCTALESRSAWLFVVTSFDQKKWRGGMWSCWKNSWRGNQRLRQRLDRAVGSKVEFIATMEEHRSGWPHTNWALRFDLLDLVEPEDMDEFAGKVERWLKDTAPSVGLGFSVYCEPLVGEGRAAAYFSKLADEKETPGPRELAGEMTKGSQVPLDAPLGTRRIRASRGLLPSLRTGDQGLGVAIIKAPKKGKPGQEPGVPPVLSVGVRGEQSSPAPAAVRGGSDRKEQFTASGSRSSGASGASSLVKNKEVGEKYLREEWWRIASVTRKALESAGYPEPVVLAELKDLKESWDHRPAQGLCLENSAVFRFKHKEIPVDEFF